MQNTLRKVTFFQHLSPAELKRIASISKLQTFAKGAQILSKADAGKHLFVVQKGKVKIFTTSDQRKRKTFAYVGPGQFFGEMALLDGKVRSASAQAAEKTELIMIGKEAFKELIDRDTKFTFSLLRTMVTRLRLANEEIERLLFSNIVGRLAQKILDLSGAKPDKAGKPVTLTRQEMADFVGTTREPLTRAIGLLKRRGSIVLKGGKIVVADYAKLADLLL